MPRPHNIKARAKILEAATELFHKHGFKGVSMDDVARASRMKKANLFHYYPSKEGLALAVVEKSSEGYKARVQELFGGPGDPVETMEGLFSWAGANLKEHGCTRGCLIGNLAQELSDENEALRRRIADCIAFWVGEMSAFLSRWQERGYFKPSLRPRAAGEALFSLMEGAILVAKAGKTAQPLENARRMAREYLLAHRAGKKGG